MFVDFHQTLDLVDQLFRSSGRYCVACQFIKPREKFVEFSCCIVNQHSENSTLAWGCSL